MKNTVHLIGNVGRDPEVRIFDNGDKLASFPLATSETWKDKNTGERKSLTEWHSIAVTGQLASIAEQYVTKGMQLSITGKLKTRSWDGQDGQKHYKTEIVVDFKGELLMLGSKQDNQYNQQSSENQPEEEDLTDSLPF